jgi:hypothetical protein
MLMWLIIAVTTVAIGVGAVLVYGRRPHRYKKQPLQALSRFLVTLSRHGQHGLVLHVDHEGSDRFLQFAKYVGSDGHENVHFGLPDAPWSRSYVPRVLDALRLAGFSAYYRETGEDVVRGFVCVDNIDSPDRASELAQAAAGALDLPTSSTFTIWFDGAVDIQAQHRDFMAEIEILRQTNARRPSDE